MNLYHPNMNPKVLNDVNKMTIEYDIVHSIEIPDKNQNSNKYLKNRRARKCRFCGKSFPEVEFKSIAHLVPELIGNKSLISDFECDKCNKYFSQFENEFASFMKAMHVFSNTKGKGNKVPKYKKGGINIFEDNSGLLNIENVPDRFIKDENEINLEIEPIRCIPQYFYRCLIKIGLSVLPEEQIDDYCEIVKWLMNLKETTYFQPKMLFTIFPFEHQIENIRIFVLKRKAEVGRGIPKTILVLSYKNFSFQTFFPIEADDQFSELIEFPYIVHTPLDLYADLIGLKNVNIVDLSGTERVVLGKIRYNIKGQP